MKLDSILKAFWWPIPVVMMACGRSGEPSNLPADFAGGDRAELLFLGVFHFDDQGLDAYKPRFKVDIVAPGRQRELQDLTNQLARFRPTKIAVEAEPADQHRILLIVGAGHLPILRFLAESSPEHRLRELAEFVAP